MPDRDPVLERGVAGIEPSPDSLQRLFRRVERRRLRRRVGAGALAVAVFAAGGIALWRGFFSTAPPHPAHHGRVRPLVTAQAFLEEGVARDVALGDGAVWVTEGKVLVRLDPTTLRVVATVLLPGGDEARRVAVGAGAVWVSGLHQVTRVDPATNRVTETVPIDGIVSELSVAVGAVWVTEASYRLTVVRIDPATDRARSFTVGPRLSKWEGGAAGFGSLWTTNAGGDACRGACLLRLDPATGKTEATVVGLFGSVATGHGAVWVSTAGQAVRVDPQADRVVARVSLSPSGQGVGPVGIGAGYVWAGVNSKLGVIDSQRNRFVRPPFDLGFFIEGIAASGSTAWVAGDNGIVDRIDLVPCSGPACDILPSPWSPPTPGGGPTPASLAEIHMTSARVGWGVANVFGGHVALVRTTDGGARWTEVGPVRSEGYFVLPPFFLDGSHAWVGRAHHHVVTIYRTADAGRTWDQTSFRTTEPGGPLFFLDRERGWFLAGEGMAAMGYNPVQVYRTTDGGIHWTRVSASSGTVPTPGPGAISAGCDKAGITFATPQTGWVGSACTVGFYLAVTHDGGRSWGEQHLPGLQCGQGCYVLPPTFVSREDGFLKLVPGPIYATHDGGASWTKLPLPNRDLAPDFVDAQHGFAQGGRRLFVTADGGRTWTSIRPNVDLSNTTLDFVNPRTGFALASGARYVLRTDDGGRTWRKVTATLVP